MTHLVIGAGEVGQALGDVLDQGGEEVDVWIRDVDPPHPAAGVPVHVETLHIAFPYSDDFVGSVRSYEDQYAAAQVVVHSTVPPGTCDPNDWCHSPVRGQHPDLVRHLRTFVKLFGGRGSQQAMIEWQARVGPALDTAKAVTAEIAKLWELVQFGTAVALEKAIFEECETWGADHVMAYKIFGRTYNQGYTSLDREQFVKPILDHVKGPIGGHCVRENMKLVDHPFARLVEDAGSFDVD